MITKVSHASLFVSDQNKAYDFYVNKLGFKVHTDVNMENGFRWLTVTAPDQPELEIALLTPLDPNMYKDEEVRKAFKLLLEKEVLGAGVLHMKN
jgi:catechol 2,3-dioxygenase-like lactoylglutathione lyase family enzyme